ncbi:ferrous iron transport protein B [Parasporobacterium paucivorans]|uniref:Ferrous iron transport protein B n=1 Tax=Parasporobacterium paucivorans DSM 15970 TaxID=1122934 RepID=A0A1M6I4V4_9FIRM|nr:ferrous iron transport protein B [Parasporobacterium paucivorans]SHJ29404.1 ferrous iron transport protein B [Parasporobacterium paucivorans DSM 15970]
MNRNEDINVVLVGNPNTGKTSLLNALTGMSLHVGNWPGKTVEKKAGNITYKNTKFTIVDLPGTYSITPYSEEEKVSHDYLMNQIHDVIVQTIDVNALERNLLMTMELLALGKKIILAFNFNLEAQRRGIRIDVPEIHEVLQIPIVVIEANKGENKEELLDEILRVAQEEFEVPSYLKEMLKENNEIHHDKSIEFFKEKLKPYYLIEKTIQRTERIDGIILNKYTAFPIFFAVIFLMFQVTFTLSGPMISAIRYIFDLMGVGIGFLKLPGLLTSFLSEELIGGLGSVLSFTPLIFLLFLMIALLEDSGYLGRTVILVDPFFEKLGITGRTFIPMILGFGCNVPVIMATRTIKDRRERMIAILTNSFISCGARLPVYLLFAGLFFSKYAGYIVMFLYITGILIAFIASLILSKLLKNQTQNSLIIELPPYRKPSVKNILKHAWYHTKEFIKKAGTIIFCSVLVVWVLASLPAGVDYGSAESLLGHLGYLISSLFIPLGFGHWTFSVALIFGIASKEIIVGTLGTLYGVGQDALISDIPMHITPLGALSFMFFVLLYIPCMATIAMIRQESGSWKYTVFQPLATIVVAWIVSFFVYHMGHLFGFN